MTLDSHLDPAACADAFGVETLLRCWLRETDARRPAGDVLVLDLAATGTRLEVPVVYWSPSGLHRLGPALLAGAPASAVGVASLLAAELGAEPQATAELVMRTADSVRRTAVHVAAHPLLASLLAGSPAIGLGSTPFLAAEQALVLGHMLHPTPKSRVGLTASEASTYSPELGGSFRLHWFAADPEIVSSDSAVDWSAEALVATLAPHLELPAGRVAVPAHPRQAAELLTRPGIQELIEECRLEHLGAAGPEWHPTSSLRTVHRPSAPWMLKLSLALEITSSRRENLRAEMRRGAELSRMLRAGLDRALAAAHPCFKILRDPAWLSVDDPSGLPESGLDVVLRENLFGAEQRVGCLAGLLAEAPGRRSRIALDVLAIASRSELAVAEVTREWFERYLELVVAPVLWLYIEHGIALQANQQNTIVTLDSDGWPAGGWYRDSQGVAFAASRAPELVRWVAAAGEESDAIRDDAVTDERLGYDLGVNNVLGLIGGLGMQGLADEGVLLGSFRRLLEEVRSHSTRPVPPVVDALLDSPTLSCKANLMTRAAGIDETTGPSAGRPVFVDIANPLLLASRVG